MKVEILTTNGVMVTEWNKFYLLPHLNENDLYKVKIQNPKTLELEEFEVSENTFDEIHKAIGRKFSK